MNSLFQAAMDIQTTMKSHNWPFCFIGGLAVLRWGEIRMTQDKESPEIMPKLMHILGLINFSAMATRFGHTGIQEPE